MVSDDTSSPSAAKCHYDVVIFGGAFSGSALGLLLKRVWDRKPTAVHIGLGDSATSDGGIGLLGALGFRLEDARGQALAPTLPSLRSLHRIVPPAERPWKKIPITVWCDVKNPLVCPRGSARVFAPQKGAGPEQVAVIEAALEKL